MKQIILVACNYGKQGITIKKLYLHILESCLLYVVRVSLKWNSVQLLHPNMVSFKDSIYSCQTHTVYLSKYPLICNYCCLDFTQSDCIVCHYHIYNGRLLFNTKYLSSSTSVW